VKAELVGFGVIEIEGHRYDHDVLIDGGRVRRRKKGRSRALRDRYGHTPLSVTEEIPWGGVQLIVGTGADGALPITPEVEAEALRRSVTIEAMPTRDACLRIGEMAARDVYAVLHVTC